jgi:protein tyrosine/serine phosphatase
VKGTHWVTSTRVLAWDGCANVRDLGHLATADGQRTRYAVLVRADDLGRLTKRGRDQVARHGIRTVINLRLPAEPAGLEDERIRYQRLSLLEPNSDATKRILESIEPEESYEMIIDACGPRFVAVFEAVRVALRNGGVAFHCHAGRDRTGLVAAFILELAGVPDESIAADYAMSDCSHLGVEPALPETMQHVLDLVRERFGGVEQYLRRHGATDELLTTLRTRLREE